jgi:hypothetical protein
MAQQIYVGNFAKGLKLDRLPFNIDNDAFPTLYNFYIWRGRAKKKRGTTLVNQLAIQVVLTSSITEPWQFPALTLEGGVTNLLGTYITGITQATMAVVTITGSVFSVGETVLFSGVVGMTQINGQSGVITAVSATSMTVNINSTSFSAYISGGEAILSPNGGIVPGSISLTVGANTYVEAIEPPGTPNGVLVGTPAGSGTINYATSIITIVGGGSDSVTGSFSYYPALPVMGLEDFNSPFPGDIYPLLLAFDTEYSYQINQNVTEPIKPFFYNVNYFKGTNVPFLWSGANYQQFWTTSYSNALWATNNVPGFNFVNATVISGTGTMEITFNFKSGGVNFTKLVVGDMLWFNEFPTPSTLNGLTGEVTSVSGAASGDYVVTFTVDVTAADAITGITQLLTNTIPGQDGIKWYDGDPTNGSGIPTGSGLGWVNFAPPLTATETEIENYTSALYYLVGALMILPFEDRLLFFSPWIQTSSGPPIQLYDVVLWSWNGTPYYTTLVPTDTPIPDGSNIEAYYVDQTGRGGYKAVGIQQSILSVTNNESALLLGMNGRQVRLIATGDDFDPFAFFNINSELGTISTFSGITLDKGGLSLGQYGLVQTDQQSCQRIDLDIPDNVFNVQGLNNGAERVNGIRDFFREWVYFAYPVDGSNWVFPTQSFLYNYRKDVTWAVFYENYTHHGLFREKQGRNWGNLPFDTWNEWREPWNSGTSAALFSQVIGGTPQGYVLIKDETTGEDPSLSIMAITASGTNTQITSVNHCVAVGDYLHVTGMIGNTTLNGLIGKVIETIDANNFVLDLLYPGTGYLGLGKLSKLCQPTLQTKQFNVYWEGGRQSRLAVQKYLLDKTDGAQVTLNIYLSQDPNSVFNAGPIVPEEGAINNTLIYSQTLFTAPEDYLQNCINLPLGTIGNGVETSFIFNFANLFGINTPLLPGSVFIQVGTVATFTDNGTGGFTATGTGTSLGSSIDYGIGLVTIAFTVAPTAVVTTTSFQYFVVNIQSPTAVSQNQIWHRINTSLIGDTFQIGITLNDAQMRNLTYATAEITLHGIQLTMQPGPLLA